MVVYWGHAREFGPSCSRVCAKSLSRGFYRNKEICRYHNHQTRLISGVNSLDDLYRGDYIYNELTYEDLERAKTNLAELFDFVGIQESFYYSYTGISNVLGFPFDWYQAPPRRRPSGKRIVSAFEERSRGRL